MRIDSANIFDLSRSNSALKDKPHLFVKVFKWHLAGKAQLQDMIRHGDHHIVLHRDPLSVYISMVIARHLNRWHHVDTTPFKPSLTAQHFLEWFAWASDGYFYTTRQIRRLGFTPHLVDYNVMTSADSQEAMHDAVLRTGVSILGEPHNTTRFKSPYTTQDTRTDVREMVSS